jgi:glycerol-3-phosphate dehydrogenase
MTIAPRTDVSGEQRTDLDYDVAIVGAGIVGCAIARELSGFKLRVALLEARPDVGDVTSKANTALLHTGFDATPGTLESRLVSRGHQLLGAYAKRTGIPVEATGAMLVAWTEEELQTLPALKDKAEHNGYHDSRIVDADTVYRELPHLGPGALGALVVPDESITCTWTATLALATDARRRGADILLEHRVHTVEVGSDRTTLHTSGATVTAGFVINAAGLGSDAIDRMFGHDRFTVTPRRGELIVFDKLARQLVNRIVLAVPGKLGKGVLISPTIYGNVMLGPTAEDLSDNTATGTSEAGFEFLLTKGRALMPTLLEEEVTATYAGLRATIDRGDYLIELDQDQRYMVVGGIRSTGLTSSMAIAEYVRDQLDSAGLTPLIERDDLPEPPQMPNLGESFPRPYRQAERIAADPAYGDIVCFCERVSRGEIRDAFDSPIPPRDLNGLRRRTRATNGRCQGFYCGAEVQALLDNHAARRPTATVAAPAR